MPRPSASVKAATRAPFAPWVCSELEDVIRVYDSVKLGTPVIVYP